MKLSSWNKSQSGYCFVAIFYIVPGTLHLPKTFWIVRIERYTLSNCAFDVGLAAVGKGKGKEFKVKSLENESFSFYWQRRAAGSKQRRSDWGSKTLQRLRVTRLKAKTRMTRSNQPAQLLVQSSASVWAAGGRSRNQAAGTSDTSASKFPNGKPAWRLWGKKSHCQENKPVKSSGISVYEQLILEFNGIFSAALFHMYPVQTWNSQIRFQWAMRRVSIFYIDNFRIRRNNWDKVETV